MDPGKLRLPYPTIVAFEQALVLLAAARPEPVAVDRAFLLGQGFAPNAVGPLLDALRFVGLIDRSGRLLCPSHELRAADLGARAAGALDPLLGALAPPYPDRKSLVAALAPLCDMPATTLPLAATFLAWLAERAQIDLVVRDRPKPGARPGVPKPRRPAEVLRARVRAAASAEAPEPEPAVTFQFVVDRQTTPADLDRMMDEAREAMDKLRKGGP